MMSLKKRTKFKHREVMTSIVLLMKMLKKE